jgi:hypothetical protein
MLLSDYLSERNKDGLTWTSWAKANEEQVHKCKSSFNWNITSPYFSNEMYLIQAVFSLQKIVDKLLDKM